MKVLIILDRHRVLTVLSNIIYFILGKPVDGKFKINYVL